MITELVPFIDERTKLEMEIRNVLQIVEAEIKREFTHMPDGYGRGYKEALKVCKCSLLVLIRKYDDLEKGLKAVKTEENQWIKNYNNGKKIAFFDMANRIKTLLEIKEGVG